MVDEDIEVDEGRDGRMKTERSQRCRDDDERGHEDVMGRLWRNCDGKKWNDME